MTKEEAKELMPIIKAFAEGKVIETFDNIYGWLETESPKFNLSPKFYRIKAEPKYRPFSDKDECWSEIQKHKPVGWLIERNTGTPTFIQFSFNNLLFIYDAHFTYEEAMRVFMFADGTPFGILTDN